VNPRFVFTAKLYRAFTHSPVAVMEPTSAATIRPTDEDEARTREGLDALASRGRLGALLIQFPVSFKNTPLNREYLDVLLRQFIEYPRVVEVRHSSWNDAETLASFTRQHVAFCNIDQTDWKQRIEAVAQKADTTYVITNNHFEGKAGANALELRAMLSGKRVLAPATLIERYPELSQVADPAEEDGEAAAGPRLPLRA
jgi:uncharacterized protein YecE (DUF72 family)